MFTDSRNVLVYLLLHLKNFYQHILIIIGIQDSWVNCEFKIIIFIHFERNLYKLYSTLCCYLLIHYYKIIFLLRIRLNNLEFVV